MDRGKCLDGGNVKLIVDCLIASYRVMEEGLFYAPVRMYGVMIGYDSSRAHNTHEMPSNARIFLKRTHHML